MTLGFILGVAATLAVAIYKPEWFVAAKAYAVKALTGVGVQTPKDGE